jgi:hypothetical protein
VSSAARVMSWRPQILGSDDGIDCPVHAVEKGRVRKTARKVDEQGSSNKKCSNLKII